MVFSTILRLMLKGGVFLGLNVVFGVIFAAVGIGIGTVVARVLDLDFQNLGFVGLLIYLPLLLITWGLSVTIVERYVRI